MGWLALIWIWIEQGSPLTGFARLRHMNVQLYTHHYIDWPNFVYILSLSLLLVVTWLGAPLSLKKLSTLPAFFHVFVDDVTSVIFFIFDDQVLESILH